MIEEPKYVELRSEEVQEILGTPPGWLVRWGTTIVLACFALMLLTAWLMRYPDVVASKVVLTTMVPPVDVVSRTDGHIAKWLVKDQRKVRQGQVLVVLESTGRSEDVMLLDSLTSRWQGLPVEAYRLLLPPNDLELGELQESWSEFLQTLEEFKFGRQNKSASVQSNLSSIRSRITLLERSIASEQKAMARNRDQLAIAQDIFAKQQELYQQGGISRIAFEQERQKVTDLERQYDQLEDNVIRKQNEIYELRKSLTDTSVDQKESASSVSTRLLNSLNNLRSDIDKWKQTYLLTAPIEGKVTQNSSFFSARQFVKEGDQIVTIVPDSSDRIIGRVLLPVAGSGKVKQGQRVIIKLDSYPYSEFGSIQGQVFSKALAPKDEQYAIVITLPQGLRTSHNRIIPFEQQLQGRAEIVTEDKGFLQRIAEQIFTGLR
jgi:multidrug efflux pump subunit AcrA (membrane-fusion protein)